MQLYATHTRLIQLQLRHYELHATLLTNELQVTRANEIQVNLTNNFMSP